MPTGDRKRLSDEDLRRICERQLTSSSAFAHELAEQRATAMDMYLGEPLGNEVEDRSQIRTREILDTVEWVLPSLMRTFADAENICVFEPVGPEDEERAKQETEGVKHLFWHENHGFYNLYSFIKDGLLQKNGILKIWWDPTPEETREEYRGLDGWELAELLNDPDYETEVVESETDENGMTDVTIIRRQPDGSLRIAPCPPEEFGVEAESTSPFPDEAGFVWHRMQQTKADLVEEGFDIDTVINLPSEEWQPDTDEREARRNLSDEWGSDETDHWSREHVWRTDCYIRIDRDGDGIAELMKVTLAGADSIYASGSDVLLVEEIDEQPFVTWSPILRTHTFYGLSVADLVKDLQEIRTSLIRQVLDSMYLANNSTTVVNERVNIDDMMTSRPGRVVRTEGHEPVQHHVMALPSQPIPPQTFELLEVIDGMRKARTGVGEEVAALDGNELAKMNTGVAAIAYDASRAKIELMARVCAEIGIKPLMLRIHELMRKHSTKTLQMKISGQWVPVRPQEWRSRTDMTVQVGIGQVSRERRLVALSDVLEKQQVAIQTGFMGVALTPMHVFRALADYTRELGLEESLYWQDPRMAQPPPPQPDYNAAQLQIAQGQVEAQMQRNQVEALKVQSTERIRMMELQQKERELELKAQIEQLKADLMTLKSERDQMSQEAKQTMDWEIKAREQELKQAQISLDNVQQQNQREVELYRALLQSSTALTQEQMRQVGLSSNSAGQEAGKTGNDLAGEMRKMMQIVSGLQEEMTRKRGPQMVEYDEAGLIRRIGDVEVGRGPDGKIARIG